MEDYENYWKQFMELAREDVGKLNPVQARQLSRAAFSFKWILLHGERYVRKRKTNDQRRMEE